MVEEKSRGGWRRLLDRLWAQVAERPLRLGLCARSRRWGRPGIAQVVVVATTETLGGGEAPRPYGPLAFPSNGSRGVTLSDRKGGHVR